MRKNGFKKGLPLPEKSREDFRKGLNAEGLTQCAGQYFRDNTRNSRLKAAQTTVAGLLGKTETIRTTCRIPKKCQRMNVGQLLSSGPYCLETR